MILSAADWQPLARAHAERADALTAGHRDRTLRQQRHAIEDFLFDYYSAKPAQLRRWHPGAGIRLLPGSDPTPHADWRWYRTDPDGAVELDVEAFLADRGDTVRFIHGLLSATAARPIATGCFGLHEWAMVYRQPAGGHRHPLPLRLGESGTDAVVESHRIRCTHIDAYRFFTPEAAPLNALRPTRQTQVRDEQGGCLHANMDLYKWAQKLGPLCPGDLLLDCFELAAEIRVTDMQASPYDVSSYGLESVPIETPEGKAEYVRRQRAFAERAGVLRERLVERAGHLLSTHPG
ncbi:3-methyladenine DNA glycosylase [Cellulomonas sp. NPDC089187]|uniref:3-methyladenine DNA glycosylase n=1 Tax=Cellulomonas sp. NPDC089187 TaxID=3154970 RepID=UPI00343DE72D